MSLELCLVRGKALLEVAPEQRDGLWAYELCKLSRECLEDVLECCAPPEYVRKKVLSLLAPFPDLVREVKQKGQAGSFTKYIEGFEKNIKGRLSKLEKYVAGIYLLPSKRGS